MKIDREVGELEDERHAEVVMNGNRTRDTLSGRSLFMWHAPGRQGQRALIFNVSVCFLKSNVLGFTGFFLPGDNHNNNDNVYHYLGALMMGEKQNNAHLAGRARLCLWLPFLPSSD